MKYFLIIFSLFAAQTFAQQEYVSLESKVDAFQDPIEEVFDLYSANWAISKVRVRSRLEVGIEIPFIAKFKIKPEVELFFDL